MDDQEDRVAALHWKLVEVPDATERAHIHLELGRMAMREGRLAKAGRHFREALWHDARLDAARTALAAVRLDAPSPRRPVSGLRAWWLRLRERRTP